NNSAWITDPTTVTFNNTLTVTPSGYIAATAGDVYVFHSNLVNQSTQNLTWDTQNASLGTNTFNIGTGTKFLFEGASLTQTQLFRHPGLLLTGGFVGTPASVTDTQAVSSFAAVTGFVTNFAVGQLWLTNTTLMLAQTVPSPSVTNALFVNDLY